MTFPAHGAMQPLLSRIHDAPTVISRSVDDEAIRIVPSRDQ